MRRASIVLAALAAVAGCTSPEATRQRGGGPGADPGNRPAQVVMHEGSQQYFGTPVHITAEGPPLAASEQARELSLRGPDASGAEVAGEPKSAPGNEGSR